MVPSHLALHGPTGTAVPAGPPVPLATGTPLGATPASGSSSSFGGGGGGAPQNPEMEGKGFYMGGEARPLGFIVVTKSGTRFVSVGKIPRK